MGKLKEMPYSQPTKNQQLPESWSHEAPVKGALVPLKLERLGKSSHFHNKPSLELCM